MVKMFNGFLVGMLSYAIYLLVTIGPPEMVKPLKQNQAVVVAKDSLCSKGFKYQSLIIKVMPKYWVVVERNNKRKKISAIPNCSTWNNVDWQKVQIGDTLNLPHNFSSYQ